MTPLALASLVVLPLLASPVGALLITDVENRSSLDALASHERAHESADATLSQLSHPNSSEAAAGSRAVSVTNASANATGNPLLGASLQFSLLQALEPVKQKLKEIRVWLVGKLVQLQEALNKADGMPSEALAEFSARLSELFTTLKEKLQPVTSKLNVAGPVMSTIQQVLNSAGYAGAADKLAEVTSEISEHISKYQEVLGNSSQLAAELKAVGDNDWHIAGRKIQHLKELLDQGTELIKKYGEILKTKVSEALALLSSKLQVDPKMFRPVESTIEEAWDEVDQSVASVTVGTTAAVDQLPAEIKAHISGAVRCAMGATGAVVAAAATLAL